MMATKRDNDGKERHGPHNRPYLMLWLNVALGLVVMYLVMFTMIDGRADFRNNLNMFYMKMPMGMPMGIFMLGTMRGMYLNRKANVMLYVVFALLTVGSFWATRSHALIGDRQFIDSMPPHHSARLDLHRCHVLLGQPPAFDDATDDRTTTKASNRG